MPGLIRLFTLATWWTLATLPAVATEWTVVPEASRITFSGVNSGRAFTGTFQKWSADISFDPADLATSKAIVRVDLTSARTGDATYDRTLPTPDWFDTARSATAVFETTSFRAAGPGRYEAEGVLDLHGAKAPVVLALDLTIDGDMARATGQTRLKRLDFGIGKNSDAAGMWVSLETVVEFAVVARRKP